MPFSHHSHSGEFCHHAKDELEDIILTAIQKRMRVISLTEHMPRDRPEDLYPEEVVFKPQFPVLSLTVHPITSIWDDLLRFLFFFVLCYDFESILTFCFRFHFRLQQL